MLVGNRNGSNVNNFIFDCFPFSDNDTNADKNPTIDSFSGKIIPKGYGELVSTVSDKVEPKFCEQWEIGLLQISFVVDSAKCFSFAL